MDSKNVVKIEWKITLFRKALENQSIFTPKQVITDLTPGGVDNHFSF